MGLTLTLREKNNLRVFEYRVLKKTFALPEGRGKNRSGENYITWSFMICTPHQTPFG
jgi:hypothetical protein